ncbi:putative 39S ribosomal protein L45 [Tropilaelaps mercedesae]|uniref:Large ribosomal subunit protein mL45 n=1 Tax=Tropilaelaps mercedesae TaxID=418985 RepID=A0A1V9XR84_9ACAR|nr:putative 39S ribosomal protein L45 [Tropilaelaps mercedesae]
MSAVSLRATVGAGKHRQYIYQLCVESRRMNHRFRGHMNNRHRDPKWKIYRANQTVRVKLPDYEEARKDVSKLSFEEMRTLLKEKGLVPGRVWIEKPIFMACTGTVVEPYVPPEGDGKASFLSKVGALQRMKQLEKKGKSMLQLRKLRQFDEDFELDDFAELASRIYVDCHSALAKGDKKKLEKLVTEKCYPEIIANTEMKTLRWSLVKSIEPARVVHIRTQNLIKDDNVFAQVTVRLHTQQTLAVYDRFGQLMQGSEAIVKDVLEYVVFEKHLSNVYGEWRIHGKIIPEWQPVKPPRSLTTVLTDSTSDATSTETVPAKVNDGHAPSQPQQPQLARC